MTYIKIIDGEITQVHSGQTLTSLDGTERARLSAITADGWPEGYAETFGVYEVDTTPPEGQRWTGDFDGTVTPPVAVFEGIPTEEYRETLQLTFSQLLIGVVSEGWITEEEGEGWLSGNALPPILVSVIGSLPAEHRFAAKARVLRMSVALRSDPLVGALAVAQGITPEETDTFFETYRQA